MNRPAYATGFEATEISRRVCKILFAHAEKNMFTNEPRVQRVAHLTGLDTKQKAELNGIDNCQIANRTGREPAHATVVCRLRGAENRGY